MVKIYIYQILHATRTVNKQSVVLYGELQWIT